MQRGVLGSQICPYPVTKVCLACDTCMRKSGAGTHKSGWAYGLSLGWDSSSIVVDATIAILIQNGRILCNVINEKSV